MTTNEIYDVLTDAISAIIPDEWTIVRLNAQFLSDGLELELDGHYLTPAGELEVLSTDFPDEATEAVQELYLQRKTAGEPPANRLQIDLTAQGSLRLSSVGIRKFRMRTTISPKAARRRSGLSSAKPNTAQLTTRPLISL